MGPLVLSVIAAAVRIVRTRGPAVVDAWIDARDPEGDLGRRVSLAERRELVEAILREAVAEAWLAARAEDGDLGPPFSTAERRELSAAILRDAISDAGDVCES